MHVTKWHAISVVILCIPEINNIKRENFLQFIHPLYMAAVSKILNQKLFG